MPLKPLSSPTNTDWAEAYKRRLALTTTQQRMAQYLHNSQPLATSRMGSSGSRTASTPISRLASSLSGNTGVPSGSGLGPTTSSGSGGSGGPIYGGSGASGAGSTYTPPAGSAPGGTTAPGGGAIPSVPGGTDPSTAKPVSETPPKPGEARDQTYNFDWKRAWGNGAGITSNSNWAKGISDTMLGQVLADSPQTSAQWAQSQGYGQGIEGALNRYADPSALGLLSAPGALGLTDAEQAGFTGGFNAAATQSTGGQLINPRGVIQRVLSASGDISRPDALGQRLYGAENASNPAGQVADTLQFLQASLTGTMAPSSLNSYLTYLERLGRDFLAWKSTPAGVTTASNFGKYILDQTGGTGGI